MFVGSYHKALCKDSGFQKLKASIVSNPDLYACYTLTFGLLILSLGSYKHKVGYKSAETAGGDGCRGRRPEVDEGRGPGPYQNIAY